MTAVSKEVFVEDKSLASALNELVQSSRNLPRRINDIEPLHLSLNEIKRRAYILRKFNKEGSDKNLYTKAHYLLLGKGVTIEDIETDIDSLEKAVKSRKLNCQVKDVLYQPHAVKPSNLETYLYKKKDEDILANIENSLFVAANDFDKFVNSNVNLDWKQKKRELSESLSSIVKREGSPDKKVKKYTQKELIERQLTWGVKKSKSLISNNFNFKDVKSAKQLDSVVNPNISYSLRKKFEVNAEVVYDLNEARQRNEWYKIATVFSNLYKNDIIGEAFVILRNFCEGEEDLIDDSKRMNRFLKATNSNLKERESIKFHENIVFNSRKYLEKQFRDYLEELYSMKTLGQTNYDQDKFLTPNTDKVINFINLTLKNKQGKWKTDHLTIVNGVPLWAVLFYLLRAGCYEECVVFVRKNSDSFQKLEKSFPFYLKMYCENERHELSGDIGGRIRNEFNKYMKNSTKNIDPFRYGVYKLIGKCDLAKKSLPDIPLSIEDWLWVNLSLIKEESDNVDEFNEENVGDSYRLVELQKLVLEYGSEGFDISNKNPMYLSALLLVGLYADSIKHLMLADEIDAVHLGIVLAYYGLLRMSHGDEVDKDELLIKDPEGFKVVNYARMIGQYVKKFKISDPRVACEYLLLVNIDNDESSSLLCQESIRDLVLESREYVLLLGKINSDGTRVSGIVEERRVLLGVSDLTIYLHNISERAAQMAYDEGRSFDCILLYQLSEEYNTVVEIINKVISDCILSIDIIHGNYNDEINVSISMGEKIYKLYSSSTIISPKVSVKNIDNLHKLLKIWEIVREFLSNDNFRSDLKLFEKIREIELIPKDSSMSTMRIFVNNIENFDECLSKQIPNLLIINMIIVKRLISMNEFRSNESENSEKLGIDELREQARACVVFAGLMKRRMPREIYEMLISLEMDI
ncbi:hypothetical protein CANINC_003642 [Pichia inconspicua]|uniref:Nuclear pore protein n=1 Tax=Pichia inconspicua TaxID=52247 RepID=A0A4T0WY65_9ASCO|nr:hypothetical protein CANINC_003642 [[Candida] inconspicua]